ncbi:MAG: hypothetical protein LBH49_01490, partial [Puniceicoccales bacterium]|nr:hypothetical protein [Puniceicoccales bacterium]
FKQNTGSVKQNTASPQPKITSTSTPNTGSVKQNTASPQPKITSTSTPNTGSVKQNTASAQPKITSTSTQTDLVKQNITLYQQKIDSAPQNTDSAPQNIGPFKQNTASVKQNITSTSTQTDNPNSPGDDETTSHRNADTGDNININIKINTGGSNSKHIDKSIHNHNKTINNYYGSAPVNTPNPQKIENPEIKSPDDLPPANIATDQPKIDGPKSPSIDPLGNSPNANKTSGDSTIIDIYKQVSGQDIDDVKKGISKNKIDLDSILKEIGMTDDDRAMRFIAATFLSLSPEERTKVFDDKGRLETTIRNAAFTSTVSKSNRVKALQTPNISNSYSNLKLHGGTTIGNPLEGHISSQAKAQLQALSYFEAMIGSSKLETVEANKLRAIVFNIINDDRVYTDGWDNTANDYLARILANEKVQEATESMDKNIWRNFKRNVSHDRTINEHKKSVAGNMSLKTGTSSLGDRIGMYRNKTNASNTKQP